MNDITLVFNKYWLSLLFITLFTLINGLVNSLAVSYGFSDYTITSFVFKSKDLHADLIKYSLSFISKDIIIDTSSWSDIYKSFYEHNPYVINNNSLQNNGGLALYTLMSLLTLKLILLTSPSIVVVLFYILVVLVIFLMTIYIFKDIKKSIFASVLILFSYPIIFMLTRGHIFSFFISIMLIMFLDIILRNKNYIFAIMLLAIIINARPNAIVFAPLLFVYGFKNGIKYSLGLILASTFILYSSSVITHYFHDGFHWFNFLIGMEKYFEQCVIGNGCNQFNNSILGAIKLVISIFNINFQESTLRILNMSILIGMITTIFVSLYLYLKTNIDSFEFSFIVSSAYVLMSAVFSTYHMIFYFIFILFPIVGKLESKSMYLILFASMFVLSPKNYYHIENVSIETFLNPICLVIVIVWIILKSIKKEIIVYEKN